MSKCDAPVSDLFAECALSADFLTVDRVKVAPGRRRQYDRTDASRKPFPGAFFVPGQGRRLNSKQGNLSSAVCLGYRRSLSRRSFTPVDPAPSGRDDRIAPCGPASPTEWAPICQDSIAGAARSSSLTPLRLPRVDAVLRSALAERQRFLRASPRRRCACCLPG